MLSEIKEELAASAHPMVQWLTDRGLDFAIDLAAAMIIFAVGAGVIKLLAATLRKTLASAAPKKRMLANFVISVVVKVAWAFLCVIVLGKLGVDVGPLIAGIGVTGFVLGFAFQESLASLAAGLMIAINEPFKDGDYVQIAGYEGSVKVLDMMAVVLLTGDNRQITIPNKQVWGAPIVNYSAQRLRRVDLAVGIAYGSDISKARETAVAALAAIAQVLPDPAPLAEVKSLDDSAIVLTCRAWVKNADYWTVFFAANQRLKESLDLAGISIPFPQLDVHLSNAS